LQTMRYLHHTCGVPSILEEIETAVFHDRLREAGTLAARVRAKLTLGKLERSLRAVLDSCSACTVVSELEQTLVRRVVPARQGAHIVPNGVDVRRLDFMPDHPPTPHSLIYTGAITYSANLEAVTDFIEHVWPLIRSSYPQARFTVTGETRGVNIGPLAAKPGVVFSGRLESVREALSSSCALVTPIRTGGGTRVKILEAMAIGTPVVASRKAAEGLHAEDGVHLLLADSPAEWAHAVQRLFDDPALRGRIARAARAYVEREHDSSQMAQRLHALAQESQR
jgi:glycosyltransferase involved in cell wall biosynthesis